MLNIASVDRYAVATPSALNVTFGQCTSLQEAMTVAAASKPELDYYATVGPNVCMRLRLPSGATVDSPVLARAFEPNFGDAPQSLALTAVDDDLVAEVSSLHVLCVLCARE